MPPRSLAEFDAGRAASVAPVAPSHGLLPSALSSLGGLLGVAAPELALPGEAIGSAANELRTSVPKLIEMVRHGGGLFGPVGSEGVGKAMLDPAAHMAEDLAGNTALNAAPGVVGAGLSKAGSAMTKVGASKAPAIATRALAGPLLHFLGVPEGPAIAAEIASVAGPATARALGPVASAVGDAMPSSTLDAVRAAVKAMTPGLPDAEPVAAEAAGFRPTVSSEVPGSSYPTEDPAAEFARKYGTPSDAEVATDANRRAVARVKAAVSPVQTPDLMDEFLKSPEDGVGSGKQEFDMGGRHYTPDANGSHVADPLEADIPEFTHEGQNLNGEPPAVGGTAIPYKGQAAPIIHPLTSAQQRSLEQMRKAIDPSVFEKWQQANPGYRTNRVSDPYAGIK